MKKIFYASLLLSLTLAPATAATHPVSQGHAAHAQGDAAHGRRASARRTPKRASKARRRARAAFSYSCPMHEDVRSRTPGECPKCGMELERKKPAGKRPGGVAASSHSIM